MSINYSAIFSRAWTITWKYKILWIFGFLAMLAGGGSGVSYSGSQTRYNIGPTRSTEVPPQWRNFADQISAVPVNTWINIAVAAGCCLVLLIIGLWVLSIIGRGGLIGGIVKADASGSVTFRDAWRAGLHSFWRLLLIRLLRIVVNLAVALVIFLPGAIIGVLTCGIGFVPLICGGIILGVVIGLWFLLMDYVVVVENQGVGEAVGRAWTILRDHIGPAVIFYLILLAVSLGVAFVLLILVTPGAVLILLSLLPLITQSGPLNVALLVVGLVLLVLSMLISMLVNAVYAVWEAGVWTLAYQTFTGRRQGEVVAGEIPPLTPVSVP